MNGLKTKERLLDAAEQLFGSYGFDNVSMRNLAKKAEVNLGAATYHFGTKQKLYIDTFLRRFIPTSKERIQLLKVAEAEANGSPVTLETILECLLRPPLMTVSKHPHFFKLMARNLLIPPPFMIEVMRSELQSSLQPFIPALSKALPRLTQSNIAAKMHLCGGTLIASVGLPDLFEIGRKKTLKPKQIEPALRNLVAFCAAGFRSDSESSSASLLS